MRVLNARGVLCVSVSVSLVVVVSLWWSSSLSARRTRWCISCEFYIQTMRTVEEEELVNWSCSLSTATTGFHTLVLFSLSLLLCSFAFRFLSLSLSLSLTLSLTLSLSLSLGLITFFKKRRLCSQMVACLGVLEGPPLLQVPNPAPPWLLFIVYHIQFGFLPSHRLFFLSHELLRAFVACMINKRAGFRNPKKKQKFQKKKPQQK